MLASNTAAKSSTRQATSMPLRNPSRMAAPPRSAVGSVCTRRASGFCTAPMRNDSRRKNGVVANVTSAAAMTIGANWRR